MAFRINLLICTSISNKIEAKLISSNRPNLQWKFWFREYIPNYLVSLSMPGWHVVWSRLTRYQHFVIQSSKLFFERAIEIERCHSVNYGLGTILSQLLSTLVLNLFLMVISLWPNAWWRHQMETFSAYLATCAGNSPVAGQWRGALVFSVICAWMKG